MAGRTTNLNLERLVPNKDWREGDVLNGIVDAVDNLIFSTNGLDITNEPNSHRYDLVAPYGSQMHRVVLPTGDAFSEIVEDQDATYNTSDRGVVLVVQGAADTLYGWEADAGDASEFKVGVQLATTETLAGPMLRAGAVRYTFHIADNGDAAINKWSDESTIADTEAATGLINSAERSRMVLRLTASADDVIGSISLDDATWMEVVRLTGQTGVEAAISHIGFFATRATGVGMAGIYEAW